MAFNILPTGMSFQRLGNFPLDSSSVYKTLVEAQNYAFTNPTAYAGQILYVEDARTEEEIVASIEAYESLFMITANKELKLVVSKKDLDMNEMVQEMENKVAELKGDLDKTAQEMQGTMEEFQQVADKVHTELEGALEEQAKVNKEQIEEMQKLADEVHAGMDAEREALREEFQQSMEQHQADFEKAKAEMAEENKLMREEAEAKHAEIIEEVESIKLVDEELDKRIDVLETLNLEAKPYIDEAGMLVLCGCPAIARGVGEEVHVTVRFFNNEEDKFVFSKDEFAKLRICMGYGAEGVGTKRNIAECSFEMYDIDKAFIIDGGSQITGEIGTVNIVAERCNYIDGIQGARAMNGGERNIVHNFNVRVKDCKVIDTLFGGGNGFSVVWNNNIVIEGETHINCLIAGGSNGYTRKGHVEINDGSFNIVQGVNRGIVDTAEFVVNGGVIKKFFVAGDADDASVDGVLVQGHVELNDGKIEQFFRGTSNKEEFMGEIKGIVRDCVVEQGDISMLEQFAHMFFGGDAISVPCVSVEEVRALPGKERVESKEVVFVVPVGAQRVSIAVPNSVEVEEVQYMGQGCVDYKDMFDVSVVEEFNVFTYIFAIPCQSKMTFKVVLK